MTRVLAFAMLLSFASRAAAQGAVRRLDECDEPHHKIVKKGETIAIDCEFALVLNDKRAARMAMKGETAEKLFALLERRAQMADEALVQQDLLIATSKQIDGIQEKYYAALKEDVARSIELANRATENTKEALWLAKRSRYAGWFSSAMVGGVAGGVIGLQRGDDWQRSGLFALTGAAVGFGISWAINH